jgi:hypothetical protein
MLPHIDRRLGAAHAFTRDDSLVVTTGAVQRTWRWVGTGFATQELQELTSQRAWALSTTECDWNLPDGSDAPNAVVEALSAAVSDDDGFTSEHICVTAEIGYQDAGLLVRFRRLGARACPRAGTGH